MTRTNLGLYIHIPFCEQKCNYCDFNSGCYSQEIQEKYLDSLLNEIKLESNFYRDYIVDTIFIGGGTPSLLSETSMNNLVFELSENFTFSKDLEFTIEINPNSASLEKLQCYNKLGINRLSIGAQSFVNKELKFLGRLHQNNDIYNTVENGKKAGFENISLDLMTSIPYQDLNSFKHSLKEAISLDVNHISAYSLIIEEGTPFGDLYKLKDLHLPTEDEERKIYRYLTDFLNTNGYMQYEISNFSKIGFESKHNLKYWKCKDYLGLGLGAHSRISNIRIENTGNLAKYMETISEGILPNKNKYKLSDLDQLNEKIIMGLRLIEGINIRNLDEEFDIDFLLSYHKEIDKNIKNGYIEITDGYLKLTKLGLDFCNRVELDFYRLEE